MIATGLAALSGSGVVALNVGGAATPRQAGPGPWGVPQLTCGIARQGTVWLRRGQQASLWRGNLGLVPADVPECPDEADGKTRKPFAHKPGSKLSYPIPTRPSFRLTIPVDNPDALPAGEVGVTLRYHIRKAPPDGDRWVGGRMTASVEHGERADDMIGGTGRLRFSTVYVGTDRLRAQGQLVVSGTMQLLGGVPGDRFTLDSVEVGP